MKLVLFKQHLIPLPDESSHNLLIITRQTGSLSPKIRNSHANYIRSANSAESVTAIVDRRTFVSEAVFHLNLSASFQL